MDLFNFDEMNTKNRSYIISEIGVNDLTHAGLYIDSRTFRTFEIFIVLSILYVALSLLFKTSLEVVFNKTLKKRM